MIPELLEVCRHCDQPLADRIVQQELILLARAFSFFSCLGQRAQFVVPFRLEGVGNQSIARIDQHESALRQIGFELRTLDGAAAQPIGLFLPGFDLSPDLERQPDGGRRHLFGDQGSDGLVDGRPCDRLAVPLIEIAVPTVADIPGLLLAPRGAVSDAEMPAASAAHRASLQQRRALTRRRSARQLVSPAIGLKQFEMLLIFLPTDVAGVSVWNAGEPVAGVVLSLDLFLAVGGSPIPATSVHVDACVSWVTQDARSSRRSQWPEHRDATAGAPGWEVEALLAKHLHGLARRADARERLEEVSDRVPDLHVGIEHHVAGFVVNEAGG